MIDINSWFETFLTALKGTFAERLWFAGLQGSYSRGEATGSSDIDVVVILDELSPADITLYDDMLSTLPHRELVCGFLSGKNELLSWESSDLFQFYHDTLPIYGSLDALLPLIDEAAVRRAIRIGACNIYHGCVHNMLHEKSADVLKALYKSASFVIQAIYFLQTGNYIRHSRNLLPVLPPEESAILNTYLSLKSGSPVQFQQMSEALFLWCRGWIS